MATILARKLFSRRVTLASNATMSIADLMRLAPATTDNPIWGQNADGSLSMDSFEGNGGTVLPASETLYVGYSAGVSAVNSASTYIGVPCAAGVPYNLNVFMRGIIDAEAIFCYSINAQEVDVVFEGF